MSNWEIGRQEEKEGKWCQPAALCACSTNNHQSDSFPMPGAAAMTLLQRQQTYVVQAEW